MYIIPGYIEYIDDASIKYNFLQNQVESIEDLLDVNSLKRCSDSMLMIV